MKSSKSPNMPANVGAKRPECSNERFALAVTALAAPPNDQFGLVDTATQSVGRVMRTQGSRRRQVLRRNRRQARDADRSCRCWLSCLPTAVLIGYTTAGWAACPNKRLKSRILGIRSSPVDDQQQENHDRDLKVAQNEAKRELVSDIRLSSWATVIAIMLALIALTFYLMRK